MKKKSVILIIDDIASNIQVLATILKDDYQLKVAMDGKRGLELAVQDPVPDLILLDIKMPDMDGYEVLDALKNSSNTKEIAVIFLTASDSGGDEEKGLLLGAVDYMTKPVSPAIVKARIRTHLILKAQKDELLHMALHDSLTNLYNRHYLIEAGTKIFARALRHSENLSVIMADIDHFKSINDNYSHLMGDTILKKVADILNNSNREEDFTARFGGEEFVIVLEHCDTFFAKEKAEELRKSIVNLNVDDISVTTSFGIAQLNSKHKRIEDLIKDADTALYEAKNTGRNKVVIFKE